MQSWSQAQCWQPRPVLGRGGRGVLCRRQMFLFSRADGARRAWRAQMGGSGEGAREAVSMSTHMVSVECDFAGRRSRFPSSAVQTLRARHASISSASRPALLSFFGTPPSATPCDISPARMLLLTPRSCGSWFPDPPTSPSFPQLLPPSSGETSPRSPSLIGGTVTPLPTPPKLPGLLLLAFPLCPLRFTNMPTDSLTSSHGEGGSFLRPLNWDRCLAAPVGDGRSRSRSKRPGNFRSGLLGHPPGLPRPPCKRSSCWDVGMLRSRAPAEPGGGPSRQSASSPLLCAGPVPASGDSSVTETDPKSWLSL